MRAEGKTAESGKQYGKDDIQIQNSDAAKDDI